MVETTSIFPLKIEQASVIKRGKSILNNIDLTFGRDGRTLIMGPNGSGKTTLLRLMHGLERPKMGMVNWTVPHQEAAQKQCFVFQHPVMMRRTVLENLVYPLKVRGADKNQARETAHNWASTINLENRLNLNAQMLSAGEQQKLALARALTVEPQMLFLDEPTANLDGQATREIEGLLLASSDRGTRIVMTTHDIGQAKRLATDIVFLHKGKVCETGPADRFFTAPRTIQAQAYLKGDIVE